MARTDPPIHPIEIFMNEMAADLHVFRLTLQIFLRQLLTNRHDPGADLAKLKNELLQTIAQIPLLAEDTDGSRRRRELELLRAEEFFLEIAESLEIATTSPPGAAH